MSQHPRTKGIVILGRLTPPTESWWTAADLPRDLTRHVVDAHLARMGTSKFSLTDSVVVDAPPHRTARTAAIEK